MGCLLFLWMSVAIGASSPMPMLEQTADKIISALKANRHNLKNNPSVVHRIVRQYLLPHVDIYGMARSVLGRNAWQSASSAQKKQFTNQFIRLVIRTYAGPIQNYTDEKIKFYPIRGGVAGKRFVRVNSVIVRSSGQNIPLNYGLVNKRGNWKIYDMSVEGVSLLQSFRNQFANELRQGDMNSLINQLRKK